MSSAANKRGATDRALQAAALGAVFAIMFALAHADPSPVGSGVIVAGMGFLLLAGMLASELLEIAHLPHLTGYIAAGVIAGPHVLHLVSHETVKQLEQVNTLALALIALAGGLELRINEVQRVLRTLSWMMLIQTVVVLIAGGLLFIGLSRFIPFAAGLPLGSLIGVALLWGVLAVSRSPSATLAILSQTRAQGPLARFSLAFVMSSDVVVVMMMAVSVSIARPLLEPGAQVSLSDLDLLMHEIVGSVALGTTLGLVLIAYLRLVGSQVLLVLVALGFAMSAGLRYLRFDPMLTFLCAGFVVQNLSSQGDKLLHTIEDTSSIVFVVFFATAGAHLDVPLLRDMWPIALGLCGGRAVATLVAHRIGVALTGETGAVRTWGWSSLMSQAGLTLGLSAVIEHSFPTFGPGFRSLVVATVAVNEVAGPVLFKLGLERAGEVSSEG